MIDGASQFFESISFFEVQNTFKDVGLYDYVFPYLLVYALLITILPYAKLFQNKENKPRKIIISLISLIISFYAISFEISKGETIGMLLMNLFPNISVLTIGVLSFYIIGAILGVDVFKGLFRKDVSAQLFLAIGGISLGMVVYFLGIAYGLWDYDPLNSSSMWNIILALLLGIIAIVLFISGKLVEGLLFAIVVLSWVFGPQDESILMMFLDPVIFILFVFAFFLLWANRGENPKKELAKELEQARKNVEDYQRENGEIPNDQHSRVFDIAHQGYLNKLEKWKKNYGDEDHREYL